MHQRAPKTRVLPGPLGPWTPAERTSRSSKMRAPDLKIYFYSESKYAVLWRKIQITEISPKYSFWDHSNTVFDSQRLAGLTLVKFTNLLHGKGIQSFSNGAPDPMGTQVRKNKNMHKMSASPDPEISPKVIALQVVRIPHLTSIFKKKRNGDSWRLGAYHHQLMV